jgi:hypothetical protein
MQYPTIGLSLQNDKNKDPNLYQFAISILLETQKDNKQKGASIDASTLLKQLLIRERKKRIK